VWERVPKKPGFALPELLGGLEDQGFGSPGQPRNVSL
jgi:hypothetical protein